MTGRGARSTRALARPQARATADAVARRSYGKLVAFLAARTRDVAAAEDALVRGVRGGTADWPVNGCPSNPEAWLLTAARRKLIDAGRRRRAAKRRPAACSSSPRSSRRRGGGRGDSRPSPRADVRLRASGDRPRHPRAADAAGRARARRRDDRVGVPHLAGGDGQAPGSRQEQDPARPAFRSASPSATSLPAGSMPCSTRSTPRSRKAGPIRAAPMSRRRDLAEEALFLGRLVRRAPAGASRRRWACSR